MHSTNWMTEAACKGMEPTQFFEGFESASMSSRMNTLMVCANCPVRVECEMYADSRRDSEGIWGGWYYRDGQKKNAIKMRRMIVRV
jgi:hypothetical protein